MHDLAYKPTLESTCHFFFVWASFVDLKINARSNYHRHLLLSPSIDNQLFFPACIIFLPVLNHLIVLWYLMALTLLCLPP